MVTKSQKKLIRSLKLKKNRKEKQLFIAEGIKVINEFLDSDFELELLVVSEGNQSFFQNAKIKDIIITNEKELSELTNLNSSQKGIAVFKIPKSKEIKNSDITLALDDINDPGNLGTIIRLCDWFGIENIICSRNTVDCYNPKVVQSTMGSLTRVNINYIDLPKYIAKSNATILGTYMNGKNLYQTNFKSKNTILVMGNEANGISSEISNLVTDKITIPRFGKLQQTESLNVATATAIILSEYRRNS